MQSRSLSGLHLQLQRRFALAKERYTDGDVDVNDALGKLSHIPISLHCWQGDDVGGFETASAELGGGLAVTGNYPGKARSADELRADLEMALSVIPGRHRLNLHACYLDNGGVYVDRTEIQPRHFQSWIDWAKANGLGMDFNPTYFSHPKAASGLRDRSGSRSRGKRAAVLARPLP